MFQPPAYSRRSIRQVGGNKKLPFGAHRHELQGLVKTDNDTRAVDLENSRPAGAWRTIDLSAVDEGAPKINLYRVGA